MPLKLMLSAKAAGGDSIAAANAIVKMEVKQERSLSVVVLTPGHAPVPESPCTARDCLRWDLQTPRTSRARDTSGLNWREDGARKKSSKKRENKSLEDERTNDLDLLRHHVSKATDLGGSVMHTLDGKRRRLDACRSQGEYEDWHDDAELSPLASAYSEAKAVELAGVQVAQSDCEACSEWNWPFACPSMPTGDGRLFRNAAPGKVRPSLSGHGMLDALLGQPPAALTLTSSSAGLSCESFSTPFRLYSYANAQT